MVCVGHWFVSGEKGPGAAAVVEAGSSMDQMSVAKVYVVDAEGEAVGVRG
jgi:hypothetical protein